MKKLFLSYILIALISTIGFSQNTEDVIWQIGHKDHLSNEFALAPNGYKEFVAQDFGYEDKSFVIGFSNEKTEFPYALPGPVDNWGGTHSATGWRTNELNLLFSLEQVQSSGKYQLVIDLTDYAKKFLPLLKININGHMQQLQLTADNSLLEKQRSPTLHEASAETASLSGNLGNSTYKTLKIPISGEWLRNGGNCISLTILQGSWIMFDRIALRGNAITKLRKPKKALISDVQPAGYEIEVGANRSQPLLVETKYLEGDPVIQVNLDGKLIFKRQIEKTNCTFECPMPAVQAAKTSKYQISIDHQIVEQGEVARSPQKLQTPADYVDTRIGTAHSRWMIAPGPWMPFSMVKMSPDNQNAGRMAGYDPIFESIGTFSHIHEWTMSGLGIFATNGELKTQIGDESGQGSGYRSRIDKSSEAAPIGYYKAMLTDYHIQAEVTSTTRCSFERFTFPKDKAGARVLLDFAIPAETRYHLKEVKWKKVSDYRIEGFSHQYSANVWSRDASQDYILHFVMEFDQPIKELGYWVNNTVKSGTELDAKNIKDTGIFIQFDEKKHPVVQVRTGLSLVSIANAEQNLREEIGQPFGWDFNAVRQHQVDTWNDILGRVNITTNNRDDKIRFYNSLYRSICSRNTWSDINGEWKGTDGHIHQLKGKDEVTLGCDAFWNTFWNLNQVWNLVTPEWSSRWVKSQLAMYDANGWLAKGPAGMNYIPVMVAEHEIAQMVSAYQMGIRDFDAHKLLQAAVKMQTTPAEKVFNGFAGNRDLAVYERHHYVPSDSGSFSNTMEYAFDDWTVGQLAKSLGDKSLYKKFNERSTWWENAMDSDGYCHMRLSDGSWTTDFDPQKSGANRDYVEANGWQMSYFVPQDIPRLIQKVGKEKFIKRLQWGFEKSEPWRFNGPNKQYGSCPVNQGNEQTMHLPFLFNWAGRPWLTQEWSRSVLTRYYGKGTGNAYLGDEDQGQMSAWLVMTAIGLFQTDGGNSTDPVYEIGSPMFQKTEINLGGRYGRGKKFTIIADSASHENIYVQKAFLNGKELKSFKFPARILLAGGTLKVQMGPKPNKNWGVLRK